MATARVNGIELYYERQGDEGEPLVFIHGFTGDVSDWRHQLPDFSATHRVLVFDNRGHGRSEAPPDRTSYSIEQMADDATALVAHAGFERYHLIGHSMGGAIAQEIALRSAERLISLTIEDSTCRFDLGGNPAVLQFIAQRNRIAEEQGMAAVAAMPIALPAPPHMPPGRRAEESVRLAAMSVDGYLGAWGSLQTWPGTVDRIGKLTTPTLLICGELDGKPLVRGMQKMLELISGTTLEMIPEAGHSPQFERPALFNAAVRRHIEAASRRALAAAR